MNRRNFLKSLTVVYGAAVVCPGELLKTDPWVKAAALRKKNAALGGQKIQRAVIFDEFATPRDIKYPWKHYYITYHYSQKQIIAELEKEFWNTTFKSPLTKEINETNQT